MIQLSLTIELYIAGVKNQAGFTTGKYLYVKTKVRENYSAKFTTKIVTTLSTLLEIHACMQNPSPQYIKDATKFSEHEVFSGLFSQQHTDTAAFNNAFYILNNCENNQRITSLMTKYLIF